MKKVLCVVCACMLGCAWGVEWRGLDEANHLAGRKITAEDLEGKVVLVDEWGVNCGPCLALLPEIEKVWREFKSKPFVILGSHRQGRENAEIAAVVKKNGLSYPIYQGAGMVGEPGNGGGIPFLYVVDTRGNVVYSGRQIRPALAAIVNAITEAGGPMTLLGDVEPVKFKSLKRSLVLGVSCESAVRQLKATLKSRGKPAVQEEAQKILDAINRAHETILRRIERELKTRPSAALQDLVLFRKTWPSEAKTCEADYRRLASDPNVVKCARLQGVAAKYGDFSPRNASEAKRALAAVQGAMKEATLLKDCPNAELAGEATKLLERLAEMAKDLESAASPKRPERKTSKKASRKSAR